MQRESTAYLWDALKAARRVEMFIGDRNRQEYLNDLMLRSAVERQMEIMGEALNKLRKVDKDTAANVPDLHMIVGMRNVLVHGYATLDDSVVWDAATLEIPVVIKILQQLIPEENA